MNTTAKGFVYYVVPGTLECKRDEEWIYRELLNAFSGPGYTRTKIKVGMEHSINFGIYEFIDGNMLIVGFARVLSDRSLFSTLMDVVITEPKRRKGFGTQLVQDILNRPEFAKTCWMLHTTSARAFYEKFGFKVHNEGIMIRYGAS